MDLHRINAGTNVMSERSVNAFAYLRACFRCERFAETGRLILENPVET